MVIGPIGAFRQFLFPAVIALIGVGTQQPRWALIAAPLIVLGSIVLGVIPWFTTRFRIADDQLVVTTGLVNKLRLTAPLDRIRSVDLEATVLHRLLKLEKVEVGTGVDDTMIELNALSVDQAAALRTRLLSGRTAPTDRHTAGEAPAETIGTARGVNDLVTFTPAWARFAPFSLGRLAIALGFLGATSQFAGEIRIELDGDVLERVLATSLTLIILGALAGGLVLWIVLSMVAYLIQWWDMRLFREDGNLRLTRGLFTTQSTTIEEVRVRGVRLRETALLRTVDGGELHALVTGLEDSVHAVLPQAPTPVVREIATDILGDETPVKVGLEMHGPSARRRAMVRNVLVLSPVIAPVVALVVLLDGPWWPVVAVAVAVVPVGCLLGRMEYAHLGHALTPDHLVAGSGITSRTRTILQRDGVIGWVVAQSFFQRRRGLATVVATTAAGAEQVVIRDIPLPAATAFVRAATPGIVEEFLAA
nr:PH domain-containing protein [Nocardioides daedukensis]